MYDATAITLFFRRQEEKSLGLLQKRHIFTRKEKEESNGEANGL
jgi:hypothetical protein